MKVIQQGLMIAMLVVLVGCSPSNPQNKPEKPNAGRQEASKDAVANDADRKEAPKGATDSEAERKEPTNQEKIIGVWTSVKSAREKIEFTRDGKVKDIQEGVILTAKASPRTLVTERGTYQAEGDTLKIIGTGGARVIKIKTLTAKQLVLRWGDGVEQEFKRK
jgi:hypothetical protein